MQLEKTPFFRKTITPWYDSNFACGVMIFAMILVFCFALGGVAVAGSDPRYAKHLWFPGMLGALSGFLVIKVWLRLRARSRQEEHF